MTTKRDVADPHCRCFDFSAGSCCHPQRPKGMKKKEYHYRAPCRCLARQSLRTFSVYFFSFYLCLLLPLTTDPLLCGYLAHRLDAFLSFLLLLSFLITIYRVAADISAEDRRKIDSELWFGSKCIPDGRNLPWMEYFKFVGR